VHFRVSKKEPSEQADKHTNNNCTVLSQKQRKYKENSLQHDSLHSDFSIQCNKDWLSKVRPKSIVTNYNTWEAVLNKWQPGDSPPKKKKNHNTCHSWCNVAFMHQNIYRIMLQINKAIHNPIDHIKSNYNVFNY